MSMQIATGNVQPNINVTPLIDVLLVLLIIFMVVTPLKPSRFKAFIPDPPRNEPIPPTANPLTLVVTIDSTGGLALNQIVGLGSVSDTEKLSAELIKVLADRRANNTYAYEMLARTDLPNEERLQKTVFIKAPRVIRYGEVAKVIDCIKGAGANPIGLQIDDLN